MEHFPKFANALRNLIADNGISQNQLAKDLDLSPSIVNRLCSGISVRPETVRAVFKHFEESFYGSSDEEREAAQILLEAYMEDVYNRLGILRTEWDVPSVKPAAVTQRMQACAAAFREYPRKLIFALKILADAAKDDDDLASMVFALAEIARRDASDPFLKNFSFASSKKTQTELMNNRKFRLSGNLNSRLGRLWQFLAEDDV